MSGTDMEGKVKASLDVETAQLHIRCLRFAPVLTRAEQLAIRGGQNKQHVQCSSTSCYPRSRWRARCR